MNAKYLAAAMGRIHPSAIPIKGEAFLDGFYYDFLSPEEIGDLAYLEETMRRMMKNEKASRFEMLGEIAAAYLRDQGQKEKAKEAEKYRGKLIFLFQLGDFFELSKEDFSLDSQPFPFKLICTSRGYYPYKKKSFHYLRILGLPPSFRLKHSHAVMGEKLGLFSFKYKLGKEQIVWHRGGENLTHLVYDTWRKFAKLGGLSLQMSCAVTLKEQFSPLPSLFCLEKERVDHLRLRCPKKNSLKEKKALIQLISNFYQFFGLPVKQVKQTWIFKEHTLGFLRQKQEDENWVVFEGSMMGSVEKMVGALVETYKDGFPLHLAPEQLRIIAQEEGLNIKEFLLENYRIEIDQSDKSIKEKIMQANRDKVPYILIFGKQEKANQKVLIQDNQGKKKHILIKELPVWMKNLKKKIAY